jgi:pimeloyl-ACP methyl ester carboxylesterase
LDGLRAFVRPTMIVWGEADPHFGPEWGRRLYSEIPGAVRLELLPKTGHLVMEEQPKRLVELLREFLHCDGVPHLEDEDHAMRAPFDVI